MNPTPENPRWSLDEELKALGDAAHEDLVAAERLARTDAEDLILSDFERQARQRPRLRLRPRLWPGGLLIAASLAAWIIPHFLPPTAQAPSPLGPRLDADHADSVSIEVASDGSIWLDLGAGPPSNGYLVLRILTLDGRVIAAPADIFDRRWRYDENLFGPLPNRFRVEVQVWMDGHDGPWQVDDEGFSQLLSVSP